MITDLLLYEPSGGQGEFYTTFRGSINLLHHYEGWRPSWTQIIPGNFGGKGFTDLLFYDPSTGTGEFYTTDGVGGIKLLHQYTGWRRSWTQIIPGNFGGSGFTDLLFYDPSSGTGEFWVTDGSGGIRLLHQYTGWRGSWTQIIPGHFGGSSFTDLLFYEGHTGRAEFYTTDQGRINLIDAHTDWRTSWTRIVPGLYAPLQAVRLHLKLLLNPSDPVEKQIADMRQVFLTAGIRVIVRSMETLNLPHLLDVDINCEGGFGDNITADMAELFSHRRHVGENEMAIYFIRCAGPALGGCAKVVHGNAGALVTEGIVQWTLAHEVGHLLGLNHTGNKDRLMFSGSDPFTNPPPNLSQLEKQEMFWSKYSIDL